MNYISIPKKYIIYQRYGNRIHEWWLIDDYSRDYDDVNVINSKINIRKLGMVQKAPKNMMIPGMVYD